MARVKTATAVCVTDNNGIIIASECQRAKKVQNRRVPQRRLTSAYVLPVASVRVRKNKKKKAFSRCSYLAVANNALLLRSSDTGNVAKSAANALLRRTRTGE